MDLEGLRVAYARDGHATVTSAVSAATVAGALDHLAALQAARGTPAPVVTGPIEGDRFFSAITTHRRLVAIASALLDAPALAFGCSYVVKPPRQGLPALWHQDGHPWRATLGIREAVTLWLALDRSDSRNGCLRVVPGSHRTPPQPLRANTDTPSIFGVETERTLVDPARAIDVVLQPGDVSAHHPALVHGSDANRSDRPRRALALRYRPA